MSVPNGVGTEKNRDIVVGGDKPRLFSLTFLRSKKGIALIATLFTLLVAGLLAFSFWPTNNSKENTAQKAPNAISTGAGEPNPLKSVEVKYEQLSDKELMNKVNFLMGTKQYAEAEKLVKMQNGYENSKAKLSILVTIYTAAGNTEAASNTANKIAGLKDLMPGEYHLIANQYAADGDKQKAIEFYNKAIDGYNKAKMGNYQAEVARLQEKIKALQ